MSKWEAESDRKVYAVVNLRGNMQTFYEHNKHEVSE